MLISASITRSAPSAAPAAPAITAVARRSLTTGGTPRVYLTSTSAPVPATALWMSLVISSGASRHASRLRTRTVPRTKPSAGMVLPASAGEPDLDPVGRRGERAGTHTDQTNRQLRGAVQRKDRGDLLQSAGQNYVRRTRR